MEVVKCGVQLICVDEIFDVKLMVYNVKLIFLNFKLN